MTKETKPRYSIGGWMIIPGWRSRGLSPRPSGWSGTAVVPAGWIMDFTTSPAELNHMRANGFSKNTDIARKNAIVTEQTSITQGRNSRSRSHFRSVTKEANADINHDQKISEPAWPPHHAVTFR